jgi:hypothetical protein
MNMGKVATGLSMSLDGLITRPNVGPESPLGDGGERLLRWYSGGQRIRLTGRRDPLIYGEIRSLLSANTVLTPHYLVPIIIESDLP